MSILGWLVLVVLSIKSMIKGHKKTGQTLLADWLAHNEFAIQNHKVALFFFYTAGAVAILTLKFVMGLLELMYDARYWLDKNLGELGYNLKHNPKGCGVPEPELTTSEKAEMESAKSLQDNIDLSDPPPRYPG